jgi:deoxyribonuclease-4
MHYIGAHVSAAGGVDNAPRNASRIGATAFALFTRNQRRWQSKPLDGKTIDAFKRNCSDLGYTPEMILAHDGYLINLGHPDPDGLEKSRRAFLDEVQRCEQLGLATLNFHPGSHLKQMTESECLQRIAESINITLDRTRGVVLVIENTAGQGTNLGYRFTHLAEIIDRVEDRQRIGVCLDTCHTIAAGYDMTSRSAYDAVFERFDRTVGIGYLRGLHLNDAKKDLGSRVDRHAPIGQGTLGMAPFRFIMTDPRLEKLPMILETPDSDRWAQEIELLRGLADGRGQRAR